MEVKELRDRHNVLLGKIKFLSDGRHELRDAHNVLLGYYNPKYNETRDAHNKLVGKGDLLTTLL